MWNYIYAACLIASGLLYAGRALVAFLAWQQEQMAEGKQQRKEQQQ